MTELIDAVYEGDGVIRLEQEPEGVQPQDRLTILVVPTPLEKELATEEVGLAGLRQHLAEFETRYSLETPEFYERFLRGEMGDQRDFMMWAGLFEVLQRMTAHAQPGAAGA